MNDEAKASEKSIDEITQLRSRIAELEHELSEALTEKDALSERESQFRLMTESISDVIFDVDHQGVVAYFSPSGKDVWGYNREDVIGKNFIELVHPDDRDSLLQRFIELGTGVEKPLNYRLKDKGGNFRWVRTKTKPRIENGTFIGATGTLIDISDQKQVEEALRNRESYLSAIIENQPGLVWLKDTQSRFLAANQAFATSCYKQRGEDLVGKTDLDIWPRELAEKYRRDDFMIMETGKSTMVEEPIYDKGETRWYETFKTPVLDGQGMIIGTTGYARDITERRRAEDAIHANEARLTAVFDSVQDFIFIKDTNRRYRMINKYFQNRFNVDPSVFLGYIDSEIPIFENKDTTGVIIQNTDAMVLQGETAHYELTHCIYGTLITFDIFKTPIRDGQGNVTGICGLSRDTTERKRTEDALRESEELFRLLFNTINDAVFLHYGPGPDGFPGKFIELNNIACERLGYSREELLTMSPIDIDDPDTVEAIPSMMEKLNKDRWAIWEGAHITKDGRRIPVEINNQLIDFKGIPAILSTARDITDRKRAGEALRESEERYRAISESSHQAICIIDEQGKITWSNDKMQELGGYSREQMHGAESFVGFIAPESIEFVLSNFQKVLTDEPYEHHYTFYFIRMGGEKRLCEKYMMDYRDKSGKRNLIISMVDITDRRKANDIIRRQTDAMEAAIDGMAILNEEEEYVYLNKAHAKVYGYENAGDLLGKSWRVLYDSDFIQRFEQEIMPEFRQKGAWHGEAIGKKKNGAMFPQELSLTAMANGGLICVVREITERKLLESQLLQAQKMEAIGTLSGGIAHDFNNILGAMIGYTELAMMEQDGGRRQRNLKQVLQACERATSLVSQILTFSRQSDVDKKPVNIGYIVKEAVKLLRATIPTTIEIRQSIDIGYMVALANHTQIHQIMMNLCTNAAHAMRKQGGMLEIKLTPFEITSDSPLISLELTPGSYLKLEISDTGHGIDSADMNRIFDPFFTTKGASEGTGLGLSVVYGIVKGHGGAITVDSVPGSGSTFTVHIPALQHQETQEETESEEIRGGNECILFVDDEPMLAALGKDMLQKSGYKVTNSTNSVQALEMFAENPDAYGLIVTDMGMPCLSGIDLAGEIWKIRPEVPVILCTGHSDLIDEKQAKQEGFRRFIIKPLRQRELANAVRGVLDEQEQPT